MKKKQCLHCAKNNIRATLEPAITKRGRVNRCWQCGGEYVGDERVHPKVDESRSTITELRKDTEALKHLSDLVELSSVPPERGGYHFSEWERDFIRNMDDVEPPVFSETQRAKIKEIWQAADLRKRAGPDEKAANLFSNLSPKRQAEMRERAKKVRLPWE